MTDCKHPVVKCINPYELIRKYQCDACGNIMMCACEEEIALKYLPHQLNHATELHSQERVLVTLGFQSKVCDACRGIPEEPHPKAEGYGRTSKILRFYWREIAFETFKMFAKWAEEHGNSDWLDAQTKFPEEYISIKHEAIEKIKTKHQESPKYVYQEESDIDILKKNNVEIIKLDGIYIKTDEPGAFILDGEKIYTPEEYAMKYFKQQGYNVLFTESRPFHVLFGIFMWLLIQDYKDPKVRIVGMGDRIAFDKGTRGEIIWFSFPEDFGSHNYAVRRKYAIEEHFSNMIREENNDELLQLFDYWLNHSTYLRQYLWAHRDEDVLKAREIVSVLPVDVTRKILMYLVTDYWGRYLGWPDLLVYNQNEFFFVEVKSSKDKLREDQKNWIKENNADLHLPFKLVKIHKQGTLKGKSLI